MLNGPKLNRVVVDYAGEKKQDAQLPPIDGDQELPPQEYRPLYYALDRNNKYRSQVLAAMKLELLTLSVMDTFDVRDDKLWSDLL